MLKKFINETPLIDKSFFITFTCVNLYQLALSLYNQT